MTHQLVLAWDILVCSRQKSDSPRSSPGPKSDVQCLAGPHLGISDFRVLYDCIAVGGPLNA